MVEVAKRQTHVCLLYSVSIRSHTRQKSDILEFSCAVALVKIVSFPVIRYKEVQLAVVVQVGPDRSEAVAPFQIIHARLLRNVGECSVAVVPVKIVGKAGKSTRAALHIDSQILAGLLRGSEGW